jgi:hypothetical protein
VATDDVPDSSLTPGSSALALPSGYGVTVRTDDGEKLELHAPDGRVYLRVTLTESGPILELDTASLTIASHGKMRFSAEDVEIDAARSLAIRAGADLEVRAAGLLSTVAERQTMTATRGEVHVRASDDVRVDGERIRLNAPESPPLRRK